MRRFRQKMTPSEIVIRRSLEILQDSDDQARMSASASFIDMLTEEFSALGKEIYRDGDDYHFDEIGVRLDARLPVNTFLIELVK